MEKAFDYLDAPVKRVGAANFPIPAGNMEQFVLPQPQGIADAIGEALGVHDRLEVEGKITVL